MLYLDVIVQNDFHYRKCLLLTAMFTVSPLNCCFYHLIPLKLGLVGPTDGLSGKITATRSFYSPVLLVV